jgi:hypothetical protein
MCTIVLAGIMAQERLAVCVQSRFMAGGLAFLPARSPGPQSPAVFVYRPFSPAVKIQENVGVRWLSSFLAASQAVFSHLGGRGMADILSEW